ncbi:MAG: hypothetical protein JXA97_10125 [Anaerolineales bacterium]|nr:hypothetical protein [Anaerolineales bacterium]
MITMFTAPKPFVDPHIITIQRNALENWKLLAPDLEIFVVGDEEGIVETAEELDVKSISAIKRNALGTPLLDDIFQSVRLQAKHDVLCYANADILFLDDLLPAVQRLTARFDSFLAVGQRWDADIRLPIDFCGDWSNRLQEIILNKGKLHPPMGSDYFIFPRSQFQDMPPFALGRAGWDNWMIYAGRHARFPVVDTTRAVTIIHQNHDYRHLPEGRPHYRLPESDENIRLAGGREAMFSLPDADWLMDVDGIRRRKLAEKDVLRAMEKDLIARMGVGKVARLVRMAFHPLETIRYYLKAARRRMY